MNPLRLVPEPKPNDEPPQRLEIIEPAFGIDMAPIRYLEIVEAA